MGRVAVPRCTRSQLRFLATPPSTALLVSAQTTKCPGDRGVRMGWLDHTERPLTHSGGGSHDPLHFNALHSALERCK